MSTDTRTGAPRPGVLDKRTVDALPTDGGSHFRGDIEGLRAFAVLLVVLDHLVGWPSGGFIGVDVFFVISGFLITGLLLREHQKTGRISFADFYRRRVRRIIPASVLVLLVTGIAASALFFGSRTKTTLVDILWSLFFSGNWRFALSGTDYMQAEGPVSPIQHYWSLAVEEQFYFVWPIVLVLVLGLASRRRSGHGRRVVAGCIAVLSVASLFWALWETHTEPTVAYFSTLSRAWELGTGALLAVGTRRLTFLSSPVRVGLAWAGLGLIAVSVFVIDSKSAFPAPWAILPVLGTVLVIASGTGGRAAYLWPLTNPASRYVGALSYSLYLWHFPVLILLEVVLPPDSGHYYAWALAGMTALSVLSFHGVEQPIRRSNWLAPGRSRNRRSKDRRPQLQKRAWAVGTAVLVGVLVFGITLSTGLVFGLTLSAGGGSLRWPWSQDASDSAPARAAVPPVDSEAPSGAGDDPQTLLEDEISAALNVQDWPKLSPSIDELGPNGLVPEWGQDGCLNVQDSNASECVYGDEAATQTAVLLGDSISISWLPGIRAALTGGGWAIHNLTRGQCPSAYASVTRPTSAEGFTERCKEHREWALEQIRQLQPQLIIMSNSSESIRRLTSGAEGLAALEEWTEATTAALRALDGLAPRVVVLSPPPSGANLQECATRLNTPADCIRSPSRGYLPLVAAEKNAAAAHAGATAVTYVETAEWFCAGGRRCPSFVASTPVFTDGAHMTGPYSQHLGGVLRQVLLPTG
jgi:peptidoglycan/LPS O-acetylase OafA/YrhL